MVVLFVYDPSAGSPTDTVLRLLHPLDSVAYVTFSRLKKSAVCKIRRAIQSVEATGGVYKGQGRNQHSIVNCTY